MIGLFCFALADLASPFKSKLRLEAENAVLRRQLIVLRRKLHGRVRLTNHDRWFLIQLYRGSRQSCRFSPSSGPRRSFGGIGPAFAATGVGSRPYWEGGRRSTRALIQQMSMENPLWGAPRMHGELLKLGFEVAQSSVAKYIVKRQGAQPGIADLLV
jgi:hypothetical protein